MNYLQRITSSLLLIISFVFLPLRQRPTCSAPFHSLLFTLHSLETQELFQSWAASKDLLPAASFAETGKRLPSIFHELHNHFEFLIPALLLWHLVHMWLKGLLRQPFVSAFLSVAKAQLDPDVRIQFVI